MGWIKRRRKPSAALVYKQTAPIGIGVTRDEEDAAEHAHRVAVIGAVREEVFARDWRGCRCCGARARSSDHCHEHESRAMLRGRPPEEIFNTKNCIRLCADCHRRITEHVIDLVFADDVAGCDGEVKFVKHVSKWEK